MSASVRLSFLVLEIFLRPSGLGLIFATDPGPYVRGCILLPLRGWSVLIQPTQLLRVRLSLVRDSTG